MSTRLAPSGTNWARNVTFRSTGLHRPTSIEQVREIVAAADRIKPLGSRHCFNDIADTTAQHLVLDALDTPVRIADGIAWVPAGLRYGELALELAAHGQALHNMASLPHITVGGAIATGTHGSGERNGTLAAAVAGLEIVCADGDLRTLHADDPELPGAVVGLGALGVVTSVGLRIQPAYDMHSTVYLGLRWEALLEHLDAVTAAGYSVSVFTDWRDDIQVWVKHRVGEPSAVPEGFFGAKPADEPVHMLRGNRVDNLTAQLARPGAWHDRLPHFRMDFVPSNGDELQTEYFVPREHGRDAIRALRPLSGRIAPLLQTTELRTVAADELWLSPASGTDVLAVHFTWKPRQRQVRELLPEIERALRPFGARPHWGKLFTTTATELGGLYPRLDDFRTLARRFDPHRKFTNDYLDRIIFAG